jgi:hypothetical protein
MFYKTANSALLSKDEKGSLWDYTHPEWVAEFWQTRQLAAGTATGFIRLQRLN